MDQILYQLNPFKQPTLATAVNWADIVVVTYIIYRLLRLIRGTRAVRIVLGPVALVILFLPELRQTLESFGGFWPTAFGTSEKNVESRTIEEIVGAMTELAAARVGALIVIERQANTQPALAARR